MKEDDRSEVRKRVAERWCQVEDDRKRPNLNSFSIQQGSSTENVIDLTNSTDDDTDVEIERNSKKDVVIEQEYTERSENGCFRLIQSDIYDAQNTTKSSFDSSSMINMKDIFNDCNLKTSILFSFQFEMDFLLNQFDLQHIETIYVIAQSGTINPPTSKKFNIIFDKLIIAEFEMPPFACHHSKLVINIYKNNSCRIYIPSNNFTFYESNLPQQVCWISPILPYDRSLQNQNIAFKNNLISYFSYYPDKLKLMKDTIIPLIKNIDFSQLKNVDFLYSSPNDKESGISQLCSLLEKHNLLITNNDPKKRSNYLCQSSTIGGSLSKKIPQNLFTHIMIPAFTNLNCNKNKIPTTQDLIEAYKKNNIKPYIVYPTVDEIRNSPSGWNCSGWFHFNYHTNRAYYDSLLKEFQVFYKQNPSLISKQRKATPSHSKFYLKCTDDNTIKPSKFSTLDWCVYTSSNLSLNAWGKLTTRSRNYEVGIFLHSNEKQQLRCDSASEIIYKTGTDLHDVKHTHSGKTIINILVPFTLPLEPYNPETDEAFCIKKSYNLPDNFGTTNIPS